MLVWVQKRQRPLLVRAMRALTRMGDASTWLMVTVFLAGSGATFHAERLGLAALIATGVAAVLKRGFRRRRPNVAIQGFEALAQNPDQFSFPSGHTATAVAVAFALAGTGLYLGTAAAVVATGIALSRICLGAHYPLDVAVGAVIGMGAGIASRALILS